MSVRDTTRRAKRSVLRRAGVAATTETAATEVRVSELEQTVLELASDLRALRLEIDARIEATRLTAHAHAEAVGTVALEHALKVSREHAEAVGRVAVEQAERIAFEHADEADRVAVESAVAASREHAEAVGRAVLTDVGLLITNHEVVHRLETDMARLRTSMTVRMADQRRRNDDNGPDVTPAEGAAPQPQELEEFYDELELRFRGTPEVVRERVEEYLPDVMELSASARPVVDIGCGRGEWLGVLRDAGIPAYGVDTSTVAVAQCREQGLDARVGDAVGHLASLDEGSVRAVTAFHIAEHLPFPVLVELIDQAARVLAPDGLLLVETPNGANLVVAASTFNLDPTHIRPLHPQFLDFVLRARGFHDVEVRLLHPSALQLPDPGDDGSAVGRLTAVINEYLFGAQDCAVLGRRPATY